MPLDCKIWCLLSERRRHIERLWRLRDINSTDEKRARRRFNRLLRAFDTEDLAAILKAVKSGGRDIKQCAPGPPMDLMEELPGCSRQVTEGDNIVADHEVDCIVEPKYEEIGLIPQIDKPMSLPYLCCKIWRWKDLQVDAALHRLYPLPWCRFGRVTMNNATVSCCNPYHYALWIIAHPESLSDDEESLSCDYGFNVLTNDTGYGDEVTGTSFDNLPPSRAPSPIPDSPTPPLTEQGNVRVRTTAWGHMYRWMGKKRMDQHGVTLRGEFVAVGLLANEVHDGQNVCNQWDIDNDVSFALIKQFDAEEIMNEIWLYNSGNKPLFISVSSSITSHKSETIRRLSSGYCYRVHRIHSSVESTSATAVATRRDPANTLCFLNISVGKGWGSSYHRIYHTDTPCRYEVIFVTNSVL